MADGTTQIPIQLLYPQIQQAQDQYAFANSQLQSQMQATPRTLAETLVRTLGTGLSLYQRNKALQNLTSASQQAMQARQSQLAQAWRMAQGGGAGGATDQAAPNASAPQAAQQLPQAGPNAQSPQDAPQPMLAQAMQPQAAPTSPVDTSALPPIGNTPGMPPMDAGGAFPMPPSGGGPGADPTAMARAMASLSVPQSPPPGAAQVPQLPVPAARGPVGMPSMPGSPPAGMASTPPPSPAAPPPGGGGGFNVQNFIMALPPDMQPAALDEFVKAQVGPHFDVKDNRKINSLTGETTDMKPIVPPNMDVIPGTTTLYDKTAQNGLQQTGAALNPDIQALGSMLYNKNAPLGSPTQQTGATPLAAPQPVPPSSNLMQAPNGQFIPIPGTQNAPFLGETPEALAIRNKIASGELTPQQGTDALAGKPVALPNGGQAFATPAQELGIAGAGKPNQTAAPQLSQEQQTLLGTTVQALNSAQNANNMITQARALNQRAFAGPGIGYKEGIAGVVAPHSQVVADTAAFKTLVGMEGIQSYSSIFPNRTNKAQFQTYMEIANDTDKPAGAREAALGQAQGLVQSRIQEMQTQADQIRSGSFTQPQSASANPAPENTVVQVNGVKLIKQGGQWVHQP